jgi:succinylglutamate desuccinylase
MSDQLSIIDSLPSGFFDVAAVDIRSLFPTPTLIRLDGEKSPPLFVSILLHGNEITGLKAMQAVLSRYSERLPRSLYLFVGNVVAAEENQRFLAGQSDFNRCWPGTHIGPNATTRLMQRVFDEVTMAPLFAAMDIHNNTGTNPHYAGMNRVTQDNQHLAAMFNHIALVFTYPPGICSMAFNGVCPALTLECGKPGDAAGIQHAVDYIDALLHMDHLPQRPVAPHDLQLVRSLATLYVPDDVTFDFNLSAQADLTFDSGFERRNFTEIKSTEVFAHTRIERPLSIFNPEGEDVTDEIMRVENGKVYLNKTLMPAMITPDKRIVRQDCLCYLMEDYREQEEQL